MTASSIDDDREAHCQGSRPTSVCCNDDTRVFDPPVDSERRAGDHGVSLWMDLDILHPRQEILLVLLQATCKAFETGGVRCWLTGGSLLGALRHGGFIPHDDDVDLECLESDLPRVQALFQEDSASSLSFRLGGWWRQTRVAHVGLRGTDVELDVFLREAELLSLPDFPSESEVFPLAFYDFHGLQVAGPCRPESFLERLYGVDWSSSARVWSHDFNNVHDLAHSPDKVRMSLADYQDLVGLAGYTRPRLPDVGCDLDAALRSIFEPGGAVERLRRVQQATWLDKLRRRNREQSEARSLKLEAGKDDGDKAASDELELAH